MCLEDMFLEIDKSVWIFMFDQVINPIIHHIDKLLNKVEMKGCKYLCIVGGLSCSTYFESRLNSEFGQLSKYQLMLIVPQRPILTVVSGAAYLGITDNYIESRQLNKTYGLYREYPMEKALELNIPKTHISKYKYYNALEQHWFVRNCLDVIIRKGEEVAPYKQCGINTEIAGYDEILKIICTDNKDPIVVSEEQDDVVVSYKMPCNSGTIMFNEFHFYETMIKIIIYEPNNPLIRKEIQLHQIYDK